MLATTYVPIPKPMGYQLSYPGWITIDLLVIKIPTKREMMNQWTDLGNPDHYWICFWFNWEKILTKSGRHVVDDVVSLQSRTHEVTVHANHLNWKEGNKTGID